MPPPRVASAQGAAERLPPSTVEFIDPWAQNVGSDVCGADEFEYDYCCTRQLGNAHGSLIC